MSPHRPREGEGLWVCCCQSQAAGKCKRNAEAGPYFMVMTWWWHAPKISQNGDATMTKYDSSVQTCGFNHQQWGFSHQEWWLNQQKMVVTWEYLWGSAMIFECFGEWRVPPEECLVLIQKEGLDLIPFFLPDFAESAESEFITFIYIEVS